jgi:hypothetical protein
MHAICQTLFHAASEWRFQGAYGLAGQVKCRPQDRGSARSFNRAPEECLSNAECVLPPSRSVSLDWSAATRSNRVAFA